MICCICKGKIETQLNGWDEGHNPDPHLHEKGERCCGKCNLEVVLPMRMKTLNVTDIVITHGVVCTPSHNPSERN